VFFIVLFLDLLLFPLYLISLALVAKYMGRIPKFASYPGAPGFIQPVNYWVSLYIVISQIPNTKEAKNERNFSIPKSAWDSAWPLPL